MTSTEKPITRADIEGKLREIQGEVEETTTAVRPYLAVAAAAAVVVVLGVVYVLGRRRGSKLSTVVEVKRV